MGDAVDDAMGDEGEEEETDALVGQVLDEIGIGMAGQMAHAPTVAQAQETGAPQRVAQAMGADAGGGGGGAGSGLDGDLQARLDNLRKT